MKTIELTELRTHETPFGKLPSVTQILSLTRSEKEEQRLRRWQHKFDKINGVGASEKYSDEAKTKGTIIHNLIQMQLEGKTIPDCYNYPQFDIVKTFLKTLDVVALEHKVYHPSGYSGIADCLAFYEDKLTLIDWKTSKREKRRSWIEDYFIQATAYAQAWNYLYPEQTESILIVVLGPKLQLFEGNISDFLPKWNERLSLFRSYIIKQKSS